MKTSVWLDVKKIGNISWIAVRELLYERVFYVLLSFGLGAILISIMLGQMTYREQQKLSLDFMLGGIHLAMVIFCIFMGISLFKRELLLGSVAMVLSKPISRTGFLMGKFLGQSFVQLVVTFLMVAISGLVVGQKGIDEWLPMVQAGWLVYLEITILTAVTYFFAVNAGAVTTAIAGITIFCLSHLREAITYNTSNYSWAAGTWKVLRALLPDFEIFNMKTLAAYGIALRGAEIGWATVYGILCILFFLFLAGATFQRKDILT